MAISSSRAFVVSVGAATASLMLGGYLSRKRNQKLQRAPGLGGPVAISRQAYGGPHIIAGSREDALFGLGFAMASDRLWQMDLIRRKANGRLSEIAGRSELQSDRLMRLFGLGEAARRSVEHCSRDGCDALEAVSAGINHYMATHQLPAPFRLTGYRPEPWTPADSVVSFLLMGWSLGGSFYRADLFAERCRAVIGDEWTAAIFDGRSADAPPSVREHVCFSHTESASGRGRVFPGNGFSNSWAISGERSVTGAPMLAFDPHLEYTNPSVWYEAMLEAPGFHVAGMTLPGLPGIGAGRTLTVAWGETAGMISQSFLYHEEINEAGEVVRDGDGWAPLTTEEHTIKVRGDVPEKFQVRHTPRGPLISDLLPELCEGPVSVHWTGMEASTEPDLLCSLNTARTVDDAIRARDVSTLPVYNASVADADGNIAQMVVGRIPIRQPRPGVLDRSEYPPRYIPVDELPLERNPARGWVAGANSRLVGDDYPHQMYGVWEPPFRMRRIRQVLDSRSKHSFAEMCALQLDRYSIHAAELTPVVIELIAGHAPAWVLDDLRSWDFQTGPDSRPTAIFQAFYTRWLQVALCHRLPAEYVDTGLLTSGAASVPRDFCDRLLMGELPAWFDGEDTVRRALVRVAMDESLQWLRDNLGPDHERWNWGALNRLTFVHPLGSLPGPQSRLINVGPHGIGGDRTTIWPAAWRSEASYEVVGGPSMRMVTDLRRPELLWGTNTLGQHESPWGRHYRDQVGDFLDGRLHRIWPTGEQRRNRVVLRPRY